MTMLSPETADALGQLEAALASPAIPQRAARSCAGLIEKLRRPVRVGLFGTSEADPGGLLRTILGEDPLPEGSDWPTLELSYAEAPQVTATLGDGSTLTQDGLPTADILAQEPLFLRIAAPFEVLRRLSFLCLAASDAPRDLLAGLNWAAKRTDIAIWCTAGWDHAEALLWSAAPATLKNHAFLVSTNAAGLAASVRRQVAGEFECSFDVPRVAGTPHPGLDALLARLNADIDAAQNADIDAARLFLHRFGHLAAPAPAKTEEPPAVPETTEPPARPEGAGDVVALFSEPFLYLKRRSRVLLEMVEWQEPEAGDWAAEVLTHCCDTAEGLRDRAANWPEDEAAILKLKASLDEACDLAVLLQIEGGAAQAQDAAMMLLQLRGDFERELAA